MSYSRWGSLLDGSDAIPIPDSVVSLYEFEDDSDTATATDSEANNDADVLSSGSFSSTAKVGSLSLLNDGSGVGFRSQSTADLSSGGSTSAFSIAGWIRFQSIDEESQEYAIGYEVDNNNRLHIINDGGVLQSFLKVNGSNSFVSGPSISTGTWYHCYSEMLSDGTHRFVVDETEQGTDASDFDPANLGSGNYVGGLDSQSGFNANAYLDDVVASNESLTSDEISDLVRRGN